MVSRPVMREPFTCTSFKTKAVEAILIKVSFPDEIDVFVFLYPINVACSLSLACFSVIGSTKVPSSFVLVNFKGFPLRSSVMETLARRLWVNESST